MFAQVACLVCGKPFQVAREKLGRTLPCPWCGKDTDALPVTVDVQPLPEGTPPSPPTRRPKWLLPGAYVLALVLVAGGVFVGLRVLGATAYSEFVAPDGSCRAVLPGGPREVPAGPADELFRSGRRFVSEPGWSGKVAGELGWLDLTADDAKLIRPEDLLRTVRDRRAEELGATPDGEAVVRTDSLHGVEVRFVNAADRHVERYLFDPTATRPRVYWVSVGGPGFDPDSAAAKRVLGSLRVAPAR
jgi:hypothetical protein